MIRILLAASALTTLTGVAAAQDELTQITWWHAMGGELGERVDQIVSDFNAAQDEVELEAVYKGNYSETMTAAIAAFRAGEAPNIVQVFEVGTATMMAAEGAIKPAYEIMAEYGEDWDPSRYLPAVTGYYQDTEGNLLSMPFNSSTPVLYYNKEVFEEAGLDPESAPKTWGQLEEFARQIQDADAAECGFTTGWQSWVQLENFSAWHNKSFATNENGFAGVEGTELNITDDLFVRHIANMADWQEEKIFDYGGRRSDSAAKFYTGECAMYMNSSASLAGVRENTDFEFGVSMLPYYEDVEGAPQNSIIGGATLWAFAGKPEDEYEAVARFYDYLYSPEVQAKWHQETGYLPITFAAYELSKEQGYYEEDPRAEVSINQMTGKEPTDASKGLRLGNFLKIRDVINEELEAVWSGDKTAEEALADAKQRADQLLADFASQVGQ